jgi:hypothetical protein
MPDGRFRGRSRPRLRSASALGFGAGWEWPESEREIVRELIVYLEDRRALHAPMELEIADHVVSSVLSIREELTRTLQRLDGDAGAAASVRAMRDACHSFLYALERQRITFGGFNRWFLIPLGELRGVMAVYLNVLSEHYSLPVAEPLASVVAAARPAPDRQ